MFESTGCDLGHQRISWCFLGCFFSDAELQLIGFLKSYYDDITLGRDKLVEMGFDERHFGFQETHLA